jgi:hypothetical protein
MRRFATNSTIEDLVRESMMGLLKAKTGIRTRVQVRHLEYFVSFKKVDGVVKISSLFVKKKFMPAFTRITNEEIKYSGAAHDEFLQFLDNCGASQVEDKKNLLEFI